ncbi:MAG: 30S ribosomal protein S14 [Myxococcales bacterium]|nr:30S ribosomal protein S14 [Myxococcales bacterium]USN49828.1 MAG: 30S ribosomal protein S14 [Myxococcales bacterium]
MSKRHLAREIKRKKLIDRFQTRRDELRSKQVDPSLSDEERMEASLKLNALPRDSSPSRYSRRCAATGTSRSVYRKFELNRISFRNMALAGLLPGVTKSSW